MVANDGGIFAFGDARFRGSMGGIPLNAPVQALVPTPHRQRLLARRLRRRRLRLRRRHLPRLHGRHPLNRPVVGMVHFDAGYLMVASDGGIFNFSDHPFHGSLGNTPPLWPITSAAPTSDRNHPVRPM
ncbi:MAG: hypothetical protein M5U14_08890 [Acidimicrobiia bacterium]|nr:hypothetical protein [Acidimicrobiia bacterium]